MDISGQYRIAAPREVVWGALNDPDVLRQCIPGCKELEQRSPTEFAAKVAVKLGPISANFTGSVTLENINPPAGYAIVGQGQGGAAGFAKGRADVSLTEDGADATTLTYTAKADVGGKLATLGGRLIQATSKKMADEFFGKFAGLLGGEPVADKPPEEKKNLWSRWLGRT
jgi:carbon monoxide dehydrogenase subunit G